MKKHTNAVALVFFKSHLPDNAMMLSN